MEICTQSKGRPRPSKQIFRTTLGKPTLRWKHLRGESYPYDIIFTFKCARVAYPYLKNEFFQGL